MLVFSIYDSVRPYFTFIRWSLGICLNLVKIVPLLLPQAFMISDLLIPTPNENSRACSNKMYISRNSGSVISFALNYCSNFCFSSDKRFMRLFNSSVALSIVFSISEIKAIIK